MNGLQHEDRRTHPPAWALTALLVCACAPSSENAGHGAPPTRGAGAADLAAIAKLHDEYVAAHNAAEVDRMVALFADDAVLMPADEPTLTGKKAIGTHYQEFFDQTASEITLEPVETRVAGDWAFERIELGVTVPGDKGKVLLAKAKYLWILQKQPDGSWKIARAIYNLDEDFAESAGPGA
ncbi:MAG TPA: SgcJ/EcaC family oxidoreductase [Candidatus Dormibacteraeota bacterium]|nr:SgcJ/EcaC family oxidoreductase [Candidatus Dormibacteraeota bacterium]